MSISLMVMMGFLLGMRHATDPDHLVAVSTLVAEQGQLRPAARLGFLWGIGHLVPLLMVGVPVLLLGLKVPAAMEQFVDLGVGAILVALGARTLLRLRRERVHLHSHQHGAQVHLHVHNHHAARDADEHRHPHPNSDGNRGGLLSVGLGVVHGLAGSGPAALLSMTVAPNVHTGVGYLVAFGVGTCAGMGLITLCIALPALLNESLFSKLRSVIGLASGLASAALGVIMWVQILPTLL